MFRILPPAMPFFRRVPAACVLLALVHVAFVAHVAHAQPRERITLYAAASLKDAMDALLKGRENVNAIYAGSSTLARQIENGAPADIFVSADLDWMDYLEKKNLLRAGTRFNLLGNRLVLIAPANEKTALAIAPRFQLAAALGSGRLAIADPDSVPAGRYGKAALQALGVWDSVAKRIAPSDNVRAALLLVARGETPLGVVYASDAAVDARVKVVGQFPADSHPPIVYPAALVSASRANGAAALLAHLRSSDAAVLWRRHGFGVP